MTPKRVTTGIPCAVRNTSIVLVNPKIAFTTATLSDHTMTPTNLALKHKCKTTELFFPERNTCKVSEKI